MHLRIIPKYSIRILASASHVEAALRLLAQNKVQKDLTFAQKACYPNIT